MEEPPGVTRGVRHDPAAPPSHRSEVSAARAALGDQRGVLVVAGSGGGRSRFLRDVVDSFGDRPPARLWIGDDLQGLDDERLAQLERGIVSGRILPLVSMPSRDSRRPGLDRLVEEGLLVRIELQPHSANALLSISATMLGQPLHPDSVPSFIPSRGGIDLVALDAALSSARNHGRLEQRDGLWRLTGRNGPDDRLRRLVLHRLWPERTPSEDETVLVDLVALAPDMALSTVLTLADDLLVRGAGAELERFEESGLLDVIDLPGEPRLRLRDGIVELLLPQNLSVLRRRRLVTAIVERLGAIEPARLASAELIALADNALWIGRDMEAIVLTRAARASLRSPDTARTLRFAKAAVAREATFDAQMTLAAAESQGGRAPEALRRLGDLVTNAEEDPQHGEALAALTALTLEQAGDAPSTDGGGTSAFARASPVRHDASRAFILYALGDKVGAARLLEPVLDDLVGEAKTQALFIIATAGLLTGELSLVHAALQQAEELLLAAGEDTSRIQLIRALAQSFDGRIPEALARLTQFRDAAISFGLATPQGMTSWAIGALLVTRGQPLAAIDELRSAVSTLDRAGSRRAALVVRTDLATALALAGLSAEADEVLQVSRSHDAPSFDLDGKTLQALGWVLASQGRQAESIQAFLRSADEYSASGHRLPEVIALTEAARAGAAEAVLPRLRAVSRDLEGTYLPLVVRHALLLARLEQQGSGGAAHESDASPSTVSETVSDTGAAALAREFDRLAEHALTDDLHVIAAEAFAHASTLYRSAGEPRDAAASARRRDEQFAVCGIERLTMVAELTSSPLSRREREIAMMAAGGRSNREIAERLVLSIRTVETHLQRVFTKLGVRRRSELAEALGDAEPRPETKNGPGLTTEPVATGAPPGT